MPASGTRLSGRSRRPLRCRSLVGIWALSEADQPCSAGWSTDRSTDWRSARQPTTNGQVRHLSESVLRRWYDRQHWRLRWIHWGLYHLSLHMLTVNYLCEMTWMRHSLVMYGGRMGIVVWYMSRAYKGMYWVNANNAKPVWLCAPLVSSTTSLAAIDRGKRGNFLVTCFRLCHTLILSRWPIICPCFPLIGLTNKSHPGNWTYWFFTTKIH